MEIEIVGVVLPEISIKGNASVTIEIEKPDGCYHPEYIGETDVIPSNEQQTLETEKKVVMKNIIVEAVPYAEVAGISGGRVISIG